MRRILIKRIFFANRLQLFAVCFEFLICDRISLLFLYQTLKNGFSNTAFGTVISPLEKSPENKKSCGKKGYHFKTFSSVDVDQKMT